MLVPYTADTLKNFIIMVGTRDDIRYIQSEYDLNITPSVAQPPIYDTQESGKQEQVLNLFNNTPQATVAPWWSEKTTDNPIEYQTVTNRQIS